MNKHDIANSLAGKTHTLGWDAVIAYDRQKINDLLEQQYIKKRVAGTHFPPITWENNNQTIRFEELTLGAPIISFENATVTNSRASATIEFILGSVIEKDSRGQVVNYTQLRPGMGFGLKLYIDLTIGAGSLDKEKVLVHFNAGTITVIELNLSLKFPPKWPNILGAGF